MPKAPGEGIREIIESHQAPGIILREAHNQHISWSHHGRWGAVKSAENAVIAETRKRLEASNYKSNHHKVNALAYMRGYEMAAQCGMGSDGIVDNLKRLNQANDATVERFGPNGKFVKVLKGHRKIRAKDGNTGIERHTKIDVA